MSAAPKFTPIRAYPNGELFAADGPTGRVARNVHRDYVDLFAAAPELLRGGPHDAWSEDSRDGDATELGHVEPAHVRACATSGRAREGLAVIPAIRCVACGRLLVGDPVAMHNDNVCFDCADFGARALAEKRHARAADDIGVLHDMLVAQGKLEA